VLQRVFESEAVKYLLLNVPGHCHAGVKKSCVWYRLGQTRQMREIRDAECVCY
jgi:hypothetical protein